MRTLTTLAMLTENRPGVLARIAHLFSRRGFNLLSVCAQKTDRDDIYCITVVVNEDEATLRQVHKQLYKLIDVEQVVTLDRQMVIERQTALIKVAATNAQRAKVLEEARMFHARVAANGPATITLEITDKPTEIDAFVEVLAPYGVHEVVRTGTIALLHGDTLCFESAGTDSTART